tara:strand:- start:748 stop:2229 length:1482 start_codon:yes stop_codon:yes gene_type:complete
MKIKQITEALKPSQYRPLVKGWDKERYADIFTNSKYKHDKNGYRVFIPIGAVSADDTSPVQAEIESSLQQSGFEIVDYAKGIAQKKDTKQNIKIGKLLTKLKQQELLSKFNTDKTREGTKKEYIVVISRHPYDIGGMSTGRGWTSCMNLEDGVYKKYVPIDVAAGTLVAYVTDKNDPDLKNPTGRLSIKPFVDILGTKRVEFGIEDRVYGTQVPGFVEAVNTWVDEINDQNILDTVVALKIDPRLYNDSNSRRTIVKGGSKEEREAIRSILDNPGSIGNYDTPSLKMQMAAVTRNGLTLEYIKNPSPEVQLAAVMEEYAAIEYIMNPSVELQMAAIKKSVYALKYIVNLSPEVYMTAVTTNGIAIHYIDNPSPEIQMAAVKENIESIKYINKPSLEVQMTAVTTAGRALEYIKNPSPEVQMAAVKNYGHALGYIRNPSPELQMAAVMQNGTTIRYIVNPSLKVQMAAVMQNGHAMNDIDGPSPEVIAYVDQNS